MFKIFTNRNPKPKHFTNRSPKPKNFTNRNPKPKTFAHRNPKPETFTTTTSRHVEPTSKIRVFCVLCVVNDPKHEYTRA